MPQSIVDDEDSSLQTAMEASLDLQGLHRVANNAQQQYVRSRPAPSPESVKRAKALDLAELGLHPLFSEMGQGGGAGVAWPGPAQPGLTHFLTLQARALRRESSSA